MLAFNSGPFLERARLHDQADNNSFAFIANGAPMVIDSGDGNDRREGSPSSSLAHNLVRIDGRGEKPAGEGSGVSGSIIGFGATPEVVAVVGDAKPSYDQDGHNPVRHCVRTAVFVRRPFPYLLVHDDVDKDGRQHEYEFVAHVPSAEVGDVDGTAMVRGVDGAILGRIVAVRPGAVETRVDPFSARAQPFAEHSIVGFAATSVNPHFVVLLVPASVTGLPAVTADKSESALHVELRWPETVDRITFPLYRQGAEGDALLPVIERSTANFRRVTWNEPYRAPDSSGLWLRSLAYPRRMLRKFRSRPSS